MTVAGRRRRAHHWAAPALALFLACGGAEGAAELPGTPVRSIAVGDSLTALGRPAAFAGTLPCDDCAGLDVLVVLHPDGSYRSREHRRGARRDSTPRVRIGRWTLEGDSVPLLTLRGSTPRRFAVAGELALRPLDTTASRGAASASARLVRISAPPVVAGALTLRGRFHEFADAPLVVSCTGGVQFAVGGDSGYVRLQRAQRRNPLGANAGLVVQIAGRLEDRPGMETGTRTETVVVDSFTVAAPDENCDALRVRALMAVGDWQLRSLNGVGLPDVEAAAQPTLRFLMSESHMTGNAGCNRFSARAVLRGLDLVPAPLVLTRRACADSTATALEARYAEALGAGGWFRAESTALVLSRGGREVARFERR